MENQPNSTIDGRPSSTTPNNLIKILEETLSFHDQCKITDMVELLLEACTITIEYYQDGLIKTMVYQNI